MTPREAIMWALNTASAEADVLGKAWAAKQKTRPSKAKADLYRRWQEARARWETLRVIAVEGWQP